VDSPEEARATSREGWDRVGGGWAATADAMARDTIAVSRWLAEAIHPQPGHVVLDVAAGVGELGLLIAELVRPGGRVIITDGAETMVAAARARAEQAGARDVEVRQMEAEWLDLATASVDGVVCRWGYMLVADSGAALREARRVLRPGGRIALAVWDAPEHNPWTAVLRREVEERGLVAPDAPGEPGQFALSDAGQVAELLEGAGFLDVETGTVDFAFTASSPDEWWETLLARSARIGPAVRELSPAEHYRLRDAVDAGYAPYVQPDGSLRLPARALVAAAGA
jgi:SAM-dependent methyltransferase